MSSCTISALFVSSETTLKTPAAVCPGRVRQLRHRGDGREEPQASPRPRRWLAPHPDRSRCSGQYPSTLVRRSKITGSLLSSFLAVAFPTTSKVRLPESIPPSRGDSAPYRSRKLLVSFSSSPTSVSPT